MTSHVEYIADQDAGQLEHLIEVSQKRLDDLRFGGRVWLWVVADSGNRGWFEQADYARAVTFLSLLARKHLTAGQPQEVSLEKCQYYRTEAERLVAETNSVLRVEGQR